MAGQLERLLPIQGVYRPLEGTEWLKDVEAFTTETFGQAVTIAPPEGVAVVHLIKPSEINNLALPLEHSAEYAERQVKAKMPPSFEEGIDVHTKGLTYFKDKDRNPHWRKERHKYPDRRSPLLVKIEPPVELLDECDSAYESLARYGIVPASNYPVQLNVFIGSVNLHELSGRDKIRLRLDTGTRIPEMLRLAEGLVILGKADRA